jgi:hypothetical protein
MRSIHKSVAVVTAVCTFGCYQSQPVTLNVNPDRSARPAAIEVVTRIGTRRVIFHPEVRGDSLYGQFEGISRKPARYALSDIESARTVQVLSRRTGVIVLVWSVAMLSLLIHYAVTNFEYEF